MIKDHNDTEVFAVETDDEAFELETNELSEELSDETLCKIIEAVLFAAGYPVEYCRLAEILEIDEEKVKQLAEASRSKYDERGIQLLLFESSCQLCTKEAYSGYIKKALGIKQGGNLSNSSLEVLAIIAYHQPVTKAYIEQVRGVDSSHPLTSLQNKNLIVKSGRLEVPGHPTLYSTTDDFLRCFGITSLSELPQIDVLK